MKILFVNKFLHPNGGSETYIFKLGAYLLSCGHQIQFFGMDHPERCVGNNAGSYTTNMDFHSKSRLKKLSYPLKTIYSVEARKKIRLVLDDFSPDVIHLNNFNYQLTPSILLETNRYSRKTRKKVKIVFTAHDYQIICPNHMMFNFTRNRCCDQCVSDGFRHCTKDKCIHGSFAKSLIGTVEAVYWNWRNVYRSIDTIICCSQFMKSQMDRNPMLAPKTVVHHNFIDKVLWQEVEKKDYVLYFGRFSQEKGIGTLCRICRELPHIPFIFAGTGPLEEELNHIPNIKNVGFQTGSALEKLIREARFSIYPSEWYENCPFSVMESQMYGTPVVGADIGGIPELIQEGESGELFKSGDSDDLKRKVEYLWEDQTIVAKYTSNCKMIKFSTIDAYCEQLIKIYK